MVGRYLAERSEQSFTWTIIVVIYAIEWLASSLLSDKKCWCLRLEFKLRTTFNPSEGPLSWLWINLSSSLFLRQQSAFHLTLAPDVLLIINRRGHLRGRGRLWAEIQLLKVDSLIRLFYSFCLSDSLIYRFMLRILDLWAGPEVLNPRYYFSWLRRGHFRSELRWFFEWRRTTDHVTH